MTASRLEVALPKGATCSGDWESWGCAYRVISTPDYTVTGTTVTVYAAAVQLPDGTVDDGNGPASEAPKVWIGNDDGLTSEQARVLAYSLLELANIVDQWAGEAR